MTVTEGRQVRVQITSPTYEKSMSWLSSFRKNLYTLMSFLPIASSIPDVSYIYVSQIFISLNCLILQDVPLC